MDQFVRVRLVQAETLDLALFDFDYDMSFAVFFLNADKTIYGRYGSRSDFIEAEREISIAGLQAAMRTALEWHARFDELRPALQHKRATKPDFDAYGKIPTGQRSRYSRGYGSFTGKCTHCHDVRTAQQLSFRARQQPIPDSAIFAWPMPDVIGLHLDPQHRSRVAAVKNGSPAAKAQLLPGDDIVAINGQPILSTADVQWLLHRADDQDQLKVEVIRDASRSTKQLLLPPRWRRKTDISWRATTRVLRQKVLAGVEYRVATDDERQALDIKAGKLALRAHRGVSRNSDGPIRRGDVIVSIDGNNDHMTEADLLAHFLQRKQPGEFVEAEVLRDGKLVTTRLPAIF